MNETEKAEWPASWPCWVLDTLRELEAAEDLQTVMSFDDAPKWTQHMLDDLLAVLNPKLATVAAVKSGPRFLGTTIGHQQRLFASRDLLAKLTTDAVPQYDKLMKLIDAAKLRQGKAVYAKWQEWKETVEKNCARLCDQFDKVSDRKQAIIEGMQGRVNSAPMDEQAEYHAGLGESLGVELFDSNGGLLHGTSVTSVYFFMTAYWRYVLKMRSVAALHMWLCRLLGRSAVGDLDRVKKICQRNGIHFRRPGRPRKVKGQRR